jgi:hypothetical protein
MDLLSKTARLHRFAAGLCQMWLNRLLLPSDKFLSKMFYCIVFNVRIDPSCVALDFFDLVTPYRQAVRVASGLLTRRFPFANAQR